MIPQGSDFQPFSSHGTHKLITKILQHTKKHIIFFASLIKKKIGMILIHSPGTAIVMLAVVSFLFDSLRKKEVSAPDYIVR